MIKNFKGTVVCASKYFTVAEMRKINDLGINDFGENNAQSLLSKKNDLSDLPIVWHFIGRLQTNKIKTLINHIDFLHSLESLKQAELIQKYREKPLFCFIQVNIANESTKSGLNVDNLQEFINEIKKYDKIVLVGIMTIGVINDLSLTEKVFLDANDLQLKYQLPYLSMGMTNDYELAIKHHATHLRLGSYFKNLLGG